MGGWPVIYMPGPAHTYCISVPCYQYRTILSLILLLLLTPSLQAVWTLERFIQTRVWEPALKTGALAAQVLCLI